MIQTSIRCLVAQQETGILRLKEIQMSVNKLYDMTYWRQEGDNQTDWSDDTVYRDALTAFENGTINSEDWIVGLHWRTNFQ